MEEATLGDLSNMILFQRAKAYKQRWREFYFHG